MQSIKVTYSDSKLRILVEEFIAMQKQDFTFNSLCSYILYRAMEEGRTTTTGLFESNQLHDDDCKRVNSILEKIVGEGRIKKSARSNETMFVKLDK